MTQSLIHSFARSYRVKTSKDVDHSAKEPSIIVRGKYGLIYEYSASSLAVMIVPNSKRIWTGRNEAALAAGLVPIQEGDSEGSFLFDVSNADQCELALKLAKIKRRKVATPMQTAALAAGRQKLQAAH